MTNTPDHDTDRGDGADTLPLAALETELETVLRSELSEIGAEHAELAEVYITGSYGAGCAGDDSDIDITVGLLNTDDVAAVHPDEWIDFSKRMCRALTPFNNEWEVDIMVMPRDAWFFEHIADRSKNGGYDTIYDLSGRACCDVEDVCSSGLDAFGDS